MTPVLRAMSWIVGVPLALVLIAFAVANRQPLRLDIWPLPWSFDVPVYLAVLGPLAVGLVAGSALGGLASLGVRRRARRHRVRAESLARQLDAARTAPAVPPPPAALDRTALSSPPAPRPL